MTLKEGHVHIYNLRMTHLIGREEGGQQVLVVLDQVRTTRHLRQTSKVSRMDILLVADLGG